MPGAPTGATVANVYGATELKMTFYRLMRPDWKANFDASGNDITEDAYTWEMLVRYMAAQERRELARHAQGNRSAGRGRGCGCGHGRFGGRGYSSGRGYRCPGYGSGYGQGSGYNYD